MAKEKGELMAEYIEREAAIEAIMREPTEAHYPSWYAEKIKAIPATDVAPVVHGRWDVKVGMNFFRERICPVCKKRIESNFWNYCPNCGVRMDLEEPNEAE